MKHLIPCVAFIIAMLAPPALAQPFELSYAGRLVEASGKPVSGNVTLRVKFFDDQTDLTPLAPTVPDFTGVTLNGGMFTVNIGLLPAQYNNLLNSASDLWIEVTDMTHSKTYPRQRFSAVPYALRVPIDDATIGYNSDGQLQIKTLNAPVQDMVLKVTASGDLEWKSDLVGALGSISTNEIQDGTITADDISNDSITDGKLATIATAGKVADTALSANVTKLGSSIDLATEVSGSLPVGNLADGTITDAKLATIATAGKVADTALSGNVTKLGSDIDLATAEVTGVLPVARGGTGVGTLTGIVKANGTGAFTAAIGTDLPPISQLAASDQTPLNALVVDADGNVGIGTTSPTANLHIYSAADTSSVLRVSTSGTTANQQIALDLLTQGSGSSSLGEVGAKGWSVGARGHAWGGPSEQNDLIIFNWNGTSWTAPLAIDSLTGNVGIGTTSPLFPLHIVHDNAAATRFRIQNPNAGATSVTQVDAVNDVGVGVQIGAASSGHTSPNQAYIQGSGTSELKIATIGGTQPILLAPSNVERMRIASNGNVGIGIKAPTNTLSVSPNQYSVGTASQSTTTVTGTGTTWTSAMIGSQLVFTNGTSAGAITALGSATSLTVSTSQTVSSQAYTINHAGMNVTSTGNVGIGTTSPTVALDIASDTSAGGIKVKRADSSNNPAFLTLTKTRNTVASPLVVLQDDTLGELRFNTVDTSLVEKKVAAIAAEAEGAPGTGGVASRLTFRTMATGASASTTEQMRITASGNVGIGNNNPTAKLDVTGNVKISGTLEAQGQWVYLGETELGASAATLSHTWTGNYKWLKIAYRAYGLNVVGRQLFVRFNNVATATYNWHHFHGSTADVSENGSGGSNVTEGRLSYLYPDTVNTTWNVGEAMIVNLQTENKVMTSNSSMMNALTAGTQQQNITMWRNTADYITSIQLMIETGDNLKAGTAIKVWGMN